MSRSVKMKGKNVDEAVEMALQVLGKSREEVEIKVISEGEGGVLGVFGGKEAEVEVSIKVGLAEDAKNIVQEILDKTGFITIVSIRKDEGDFIELDIKGEDMGRIIGKDGATIDALQYLSTIILSKKQQRRIRLIVDAENYRERKEKRIIEGVKEVADEVDKSGKERQLQPMPASERRIIHLFIQEQYPKLTSFSKGEGADRLVVIAPKGQ